MTGGRRGFTLIEILITIGILAMVMVTAMSLFDGITRAEDRARRAIGRGRAAEVLLDRVQAELVGAVMVVRADGTDPFFHPYLFYSPDGGSGLEDLDALRFITQTPAQVPGDSDGYGLRLVTYATVERGDEIVDLVRDEAPLPVGLQRDVRTTQDGQVVVEDLASFVLRFQAEGSSSWDDSWDSTAVARLDDLPVRVEVGISLMEEDEFGGAVAGDEHLRLVELPVRPFDLTPLDPNALPEVDQLLDGECGLFVEACIARYAREIYKILPPADAEMLNTIRRQLRPNTCWNSQGAAAVSLKLHLERFGIQLDSKCGR